MTHAISSTHIDFKKIESVVSSNTKLVLSDEAIKRIENCRSYLDNKMVAHRKPIYGINTGFGSLYDKSIDASQLEQLQENLVMSHACGTGNEVSHDIVRLMLFLKIQGLAYGNSGVQLLTVQRLIDFYNNGIYPVVYEQGSLGASGDLAPLAHLCLPLLGYGEVYCENKKMPTANVLKKFNWQPIKLKSKEGLALLNGTQFMSSYFVFCLLKAQKLSQIADLIGALSLEAYDGRPEPFHHLIQQIRPHPGQIQTALNFRTLLDGSQIIKQEKKHIQDPYSFRCIPQVHGASKDAINYCASVLFNEINSVTDNPTIFPEEDLIISAGNFHGQPLALPLDFMALALSELGSISERRTYLLISGQRGLPLYLVSNPGLNSGMMIPQYTAASIVSQNKQLCMPASADSIVSSNGQEDHVSMGANAATKLLRVVNNLQTILAIELLNAAQGIEFRKPLTSSIKLEKLFADFRKVVPPLSNDRILHTDIKLSEKFLEELNIEEYL
ncbi:MAG TPA: histidine ammonia-lyase [Bacteroidia bacterium]|nr:histidine ammonia-lyase [Bacteroidia bacterium]HNU32787.1 histidine ammonia-lyase [Bacteroidia bacterium]